MCPLVHMQATQQEYHQYLSNDRLYDQSFIKCLVDEMNQEIDVSLEWL